MLHVYLHVSAFSFLNGRPVFTNLGSEFAIRDYINVVFYKFPTVSNENLAPFNSAS
jgi:hypothetical protein